MQDPLREIYELWEGKMGRHPMTKEERAVWNRAEAVLGKNAIDELVHAQSRSLAEEQYDCFRTGFRLGVRLILDAR